jgi:hypothetical protein
MFSLQREWIKTCLEGAAVATIADNALRAIWFHPTNLSFTFLCSFAALADELNAITTTVEIKGSCSCFLHFVKHAFITKVLPLLSPCRSNFFESNDEGWWVCGDLSMQLNAARTLYFITGQQGSHFQSASQQKEALKNHRIWTSNGQVADSASKPLSNDPSTCCTDGFDSEAQQARLTPRVIR